MKVDRVTGQLDLLLLGTLHAAPAHGYGVITALRERSGGAFDLTEGSVYPALHRLEAAGLLSSSWAPVGGRRRRIYTLTDRGVGALDGERRDWHALVAAVEAAIRPAGAATTRTVTA